MGCDPIRRKKSGQSQNGKESRKLYLVRRFHYFSTMTFNNSPVDSPISVHDEFSTLTRIVIGLGTPYQQNKEQVANEMAEFPLVPNTARMEEVLALTYPTESILIPEYEDYIATLEKYGVDVLRADPGIAYSFDYTCPWRISASSRDR